MNYGDAVSPTQGGYGGGYMYQGGMLSPGQQQQQYEQQQQFMYDQQQHQQHQQQYMRYQPPPPQMPNFFHNAPAPARQPVWPRGNEFPPQPFQQQQQAQPFGNPLHQQQQPMAPQPLGSAIRPQKKRNDVMRGPRPAGPPKEDIFDRTSTSFVAESGNASILQDGDESHRNMTMEGTPARHPMGRVADLSGDAVDEDGARREIDTCVTVFGFAPEDAAFIISEFESYGVIVRRKCEPNANWVHLEYSTPMEARMALSKSTSHVFARRILIGVVPTASLKVGESDLAIQCREFCDGKQKDRTQMERSILGTPLTKQRTPRELSSRHASSLASSPSSNTPRKSSGLIGGLREYVLGW